MEVEVKKSRLTDAKAKNVPVLLRTKVATLTFRPFRPFTPFNRLLLAALSFVILPGQTVLAQSTTGKIEEAAKKIGEFLQQLGMIALVALLPAGCFVFMFGGFSDTQRATGVRILVFSLLGVLGLLLFAQPIADFIGETFKPA
jgi:cytochrome bd-type quinol oxidase subunit 2